MLASIPASKVVSIHPSVVSAGSAALALNTVVLSSNSDLPINEFASATDVGSAFGLGSDEYKFAQTYFAGYDGATQLPKSLIISKYNTTDVAARLIGANQRTLTIDQIKKVKGVLALTVDGVQATSEAIDLSAITSLSDAAQKIGTALNINCVFNTQLQAFTISSKTRGKVSSISFASGELADLLKLTEATGAQVDNATIADSIDSALERVTSYTLNFAVITHLGVAFTTALCQSIALWISKQDNRFWYVYYAQEPTALLANNNNCFGQFLKDNNVSGVTPIYGTLQHAAVACGYAASLNFDETNGRATLNFKNQAGVKASVTSTADANALETNGYAYYAAVATAQTRFIFFLNTVVSGSFKFVDSYLNQIYLNAQLQLAFISMLKNYKAIPYNAEGKAIHRATAQDPINQLVNFGGIQAGVELSNQQKLLINRDAGFDAASQIATTGYCFSVGDVTPEIRAVRSSLPLKFWYADGGSVHSINLASINVQ